MHVPIRSEAEESLHNGLIWSPYCGEAPAPEALWTRWNGDPVLLLALLAAAGAYARWVGPTPGARPALFAAALGALLLSFVSPLCALSSALFSARVVHHVLLVAVAAPLLAWSLPRRNLDGWGGLLAWTTLHVALFWLWHAPAAYAAALSHDGLYWLMQASLLGSAVGFWAAARRAPAPAAVAALLAVMVQMGLLGALLTFAPHPFYAPHLLTTATWGLSPVEDQQLGGLIMWAPAAGLYLAAALLLLGRMLGRDPRPAAAA